MASPLSIGLIGAALSLTTAQAFAQTPDRFPFVLPWDDASHTVIDNANLNPAPLSDRSRISIKNGHFYDASGRRVRFLGTNITASGNFSDPADSAKVAGRLHKFGFNIVRLHHMDAPWSQPNIFGTGEGGPTTQVSPDSMARLDTLVGELKKRGIYVNLNLHVARVLNASDGFPDVDKLPGSGKVIAYFDPQFIALQKDYARQILNRTNTVTGKRWADDPAVAVVELNNEDTLVSEAWNGSLQALPPRYRGTLQSGWNTFLKTRYQTTAALRAAWQDGPTDNTNLLRNAQFGDGTNAWTLETQGEARAQTSVVSLDAPADAGVATAPTGKALKVTIEKLPDIDWKLQFHQTGLNLREGQTYTASFWAKSDRERKATATLSLDQSPWNQVGASSPLALAPKWQRFSFTFRAHDTQPNHSRFSFTLGNEMGDVSLADLQLHSGIELQLPAAQTLETGTVDLPAPRAATPRQSNDWVEYLMAVEKSYVDTMTDTLRKEIGYKGLITCSQASYGGFGGVLRESRTDWIDMHAYWQHPDFPNKPWDGNDWRIPNTAMTDDLNTGTLLGLAAYRVAGKPFTVSEYNHPAPNDYASETVPLILSYAAAQDWDGVYLFDYNSNRANWDEDKIRGYFSTGSDPNKMLMVPALARAFLQGEVPTFRSQTTLTLSRDAMNRLVAATADSGSFWSNVPDTWKKYGLSRNDVVNSRIALQITEGTEAPKLTRSGQRGGSWAWTWNGQSGAISVETPTLQVQMGRLGDSWRVGPLINKAWTVEDLRSSNGWATLALQARDGKPTGQSKSLLVTVLNRAENIGMAWNADRTSIGTGWGEGPVQLEVPSARISIATGASAVKVYPLNSMGARLFPISSKLEKGMVTFQLSPSSRTPWFEIEATFPAPQTPKAKAAKK